MSLLRTATAPVCSRYPSTNSIAVCGTSHYCDEPDLILYLHTPAAVCQERLRARARQEEVGVTLEYLLQLEALHDEWLLHDPHVLVLDGERCWSAEEVEKVAESRLREH